MTTVTLESIMPNVSAVEIVPDKDRLLAYREKAQANRAAVTPNLKTIQGRRTGIIVDKRFSKDSDGFEDMDAFWEMASNGDDVSSIAPPMGEGSASGRSTPAAAAPPTTTATTPAITGGSKAGRPPSRGGSDSLGSGTGAAASGGIMSPDLGWTPTASIRRRSSGVASIRAETPTASIGGDEEEEEEEKEEEPASPPPPPPPSSQKEETHQQQPPPTSQGRGLGGGRRKSAAVEKSPTAAAVSTPAPHPRPTRRSSAAAAAAEEELAAIKAQTEGEEEAAAAAKKAQTEGGVKLPKKRRGRPPKAKAATPTLKPVPENRVDIAMLLPTPGGAAGDTPVAATSNGGGKGTRRLDFLQKGAAAQPRASPEPSESEPATEEELEAEEEEAAQKEKERKAAAEKGQKKQKEKKTAAAAAAADVQKPLFSTRRTRSSPAARGGGEEEPAAVATPAVRKDVDDWGADDDGFGPDDDWQAPEVGSQEEEEKQPTPRKSPPSSASNGRRRISVEVDNDDEEEEDEQLQQQEAEEEEEEAEKEKEKQEKQQKEEKKEAAASKKAKAKAAAAAAKVKPPQKKSKAAVAASSKAKRRRDADEVDTELSSYEDDEGAAGGGEGASTKERPTKRGPGERSLKSLRVSEYNSRDMKGKSLLQSSEENGARRTGRARLKPVEFWKNERPVYMTEEVDDVAYVEGGRKKTGDQKVDVQKLVSVHATDKTPTPRKFKGSKARRRAARRKAEAEMMIDPEEVYQQYPDYHFAPPNVGKAKVWDEVKALRVTRRLVLPKDAMSIRTLNDVVGLKAGQAFHMHQSQLQIEDEEYGDKKDIIGHPGWIVGRMTLEPGIAKQPESVGQCSQIFHVLHCEGNSLEFAVDQGIIKFQEERATRFLLSQGDTFYLPPANTYCLRNHSETVKADVFWTIIKPYDAAGAGVEDEEEEEEQVDEEVEEEEEEEEREVEEEEEKGKKKSLKRMRGNGRVQGVAKKKKKARKEESSEEEEESKGEGSEDIGGESSDEE